MAWRHRVTTSRCIWIRSPAWSGVAVSAGAIALNCDLRRFWLVRYGRPGSGRGCGIFGPLSRAWGGGAGDEPRSGPRRANPYPVRLMRPPVGAAVRNGTTGSRGCSSTLQPVLVGPSVLHELSQPGSRLWTSRRHSSRRRWPHSVPPGCARGILRWMLSGASVQFQHRPGDSHDENEAVSLTLLAV